MSKMMLYDFVCPTGHSHEALVTSDQRAKECPQCGKQSTRTIPAPRAVLEGISGDFPTAADAWVKRRESRMKQERKAVESHGTYEDLYK